MKNKDYYDLNELEFRTMTTIHDTLKCFQIYELKLKTIIFFKKYDGHEYANRAVSDYNLWLNLEHEPLDTKERDYLRVVISPFRHNVENIVKQKSGSNEFIRVMLSNDYLTFPSFRKDTLYRGMELGKAYTLEELGQ